MGSSEICFGGGETITGYAKITSGMLFEYLKDIVLVGRVTEDEEYYIYGCHWDDEEKFYRGVYEADKSMGSEGLGFKSPKDVEEYWKDPDMIFLTVEKGCFKILPKEEVENGGKKNVKRSNKET